ncbi:MAG: nucleotidyl transferase AbiEii/AbiGii toxin family protein [Bacteroidetes bacterium]|nr:nucleotidyl transferase AbiEii/AbiGii toxin family protein [Bacteroidota bacterium]
MQVPELGAFALAGGTCLALRYGHRKSIDIDLFSTQDFDNDELVEKLNENGFVFQETFFANKIGVFGKIKHIKVDFVRHHQFPILQPLELSQDIRMFSDTDIIAMKIQAVLRRAVKKDFWDIAELLSHYSMDFFTECYQKKYPNQLLLISIPRALSYFDDAENSPAPNCLRGWTWEDVKQKIRHAVNEYLK